MPCAVERFVNTVQKWDWELSGNQKRIEGWWRTGIANSCARISHWGRWNLKLVVRHTRQGNGLQDHEVAGGEKQRTTIRYMIAARLKPNTGKTDVSVHLIQKNVAKHLVTAPRLMARIIIVFNTLSVLFTKSTTGSCRRANDAYGLNPVRFPCNKKHNTTVMLMSQTAVARQNVILKGRTFGLSNLLYLGIWALNMQDDGINDYFGVWCERRTQDRNPLPKRKKFGGMSDSDSLLEEDVHTPHPATEPTINN
jgi:hypothetical protein